MKKEVISIRKKVPQYDNLILPFKSWQKHINAIGDGYSLKLYPTMEFQSSNLSFNGVAQQVYTLACRFKGRVFVRFYNAVGDGLQENVFYSENYPDGQLVERFTSPVGTTLITVYHDNNLLIGDVSFLENPILVEGSFNDLIFFEAGVKKVKERLKDSGSVQEVRIRFYPGCERSLQVRPYILHKAGRAEDFFTYPVKTEGYITGDDDYLIFPVTLDFDYDDELVIEFDNVGNYIYTLSVDVVVSYYREESL